MRVDETKQQVRARIRASRSARPAGQRAADAEALAGRAASILPTAPAGVSCYLSLPAEPGTDQLIAAMHAAGLRVVVPRIEGRRLHWIELRPDSTLASGPMGIREPLGEPMDTADLGGLSLMLVPATALDRQGHRLGQGGGYYDRTLADVPAHALGGPLRVAVVHDDEVLDRIPVEPHDCPVDAALTPSRILRFD